MCFCTYAWKKLMYENLHPKMSWGWEKWMKRKKERKKSVALKTYCIEADEAASLLMYEILTLRDKVTYIWLT